MRIKSIYSLYFALISSLGTFLFGFYATLIGGIIFYINKDFALTTFQEAIIVSTLVIGAMLGAFLGGVLADYKGRKWTLLFSAVLLILGGLLFIYAFNIYVLVISRLIVGLGVGIATNVVPLYISETSSQENVGPYVLLSQIMGTLGVVVTFGLSLYMTSWKEITLLGGLIPSFLLFILGWLFLDETPIWLEIQGKKIEAAKVFEKLHLPHPKPSSIFVFLKNLFVKMIAKSIQKRLIGKLILIGIFVAFFQQAIGIYGIAYFAPQMFQKLGLASQSIELVLSFILALLNFIATLFSVPLLAYLSRKKLLILGMSGIFFSLLLLCSSLAFSLWVKVLPSLAILLYIVFFAISVGPVTFVVISEIFPNEIRGKAMGICIFVHLFTNYLITLTFLPMLNSLGVSTLFSIYAFFALLGIGFYAKFLPNPHS
jgi:sugar porter (SP) family MFS transporter